MALFTDIVGDCFRYPDRFGTISAGVAGLFAVPGGICVMAAGTRYFTMRRNLPGKDLRFNLVTVDTAVL
jgi:hypothetical protein